MFAKPYKLKSNTTLKNSEKKHLAQRIHDEFPSTTEEKVKELVPVKSSCICMKLVLHSGDTVNVYSVDGSPVVIEAEEGLLPTVCALWRVPDLVPMLTIHTPVLPKIKGGVPLYLPGLEIPAGGVGFPHFARGTIIAMCTQDNAAAAVVGRAAISSADMLLRATGVCLDTIQVFGDQLCKDAKFGKIERPKLGPASSRGDSTTNLTANVAQLSIQPVIKDEWPSLGRPAQAPREPPPPREPHVPREATAPQPAAPNEPRLIADSDAPHIQHNAEHQAEEDLEDCMTTEGPAAWAPPADMDGLLRWSLLCFLKRDAKHAELPLKTNLLYKNHLIALCPEDRTLDVKKSSYKKLGKFLEAMQEEGLVEVRELEKGVDAVVALNSSHPLVLAHRAPRAAASTREPEREHEYTPPQVREMYCVTAAVAELFAPLKKGAALAAGEVRGLLTDYVKARGLHAAAVKGAVALDPLLAKILGKQEQEAVKWDALMAGVLARMTPATEMRFADGDTRLNKARLEPITMQVATRSGNKKVTLVSNLESFGFSLAALCRASQLGAAAACRATREPGARRDQLMLQGDQTHFVAKLLIEKYGLPKKFVEGADKALNKKK